VSTNFKIFGFLLISLCFHTLKISAVEAAEQIKIVQAPIKSNDASALITEAIDTLTEGSTLVLRGDFRTSTIPVVNKKGINIKIEGTLESIYNQVRSLKKDSYPSRNPLFQLVNDQNIQITGGVIRNKYHEGIVILNSKEITISTAILGNSLGDQYDGIYINKCDDCSVQNSRIERTSKIASSGYGEGSGIAIFTSDRVEVKNSKLIANGANGIYLGSGKNTLIQMNEVSHNGMSGIQVNFNIPNKQTQYFTISDNLIMDNRADGIDCNNTTLPYSVYGVIDRNKLKHNGWLMDEATADGTGVGTFINISNISIMDNTSEDSARFGAFFSGVTNFSLVNNTIKKNPNSLGAGLYIQNSKYGTIKGNQVLWALGLETVKIYGVVTDILLENNFFLGELIVPVNSGSLDSDTKYENIQFKNNEFQSKDKVSSPGATFTNNALYH
jgi:parallel beta-helix repeat protein